MNDAATCYYLLDKEGESLPSGINDDGAGMLFVQAAARHFEALDKQCSTSSGKDVLSKS